MSDYQLMRSLLGEVAATEREAARVGGKLWTLFVRDAERRFGQPWPVIRAAIDAYHEGRAA